MQIDIKNLLTSLNKMRINKDSIDNEVTIQCLEWIRLRANYNLLISTNVRQSDKDEISNGWKIIKEGNFTVLYNETSVAGYGADEPVSIAAFIEFGIGLVGQGTYEGDKGNYEYNVDSEAKQKALESGYPDAWYYFGYTQGNEAEAFLYKAYRDFVDRGICATIYEKVMKAKNGW